jgi:sialic acid synthase SpsE
MTSISSYLKSDRPFVIAEIGNNHEGDIGVARELVYAAHEAGVDSVKFQSIVPSSLVSSDQEQRIKQLEGYCLDFEEFQELAELSSKLNLVFFSSVFDIQLIEKLKKIQQIFKVSSGDNTYFDLIDELAATDYPAIISTGGLNLKQIDKLYHGFLSVQPDTDKLALLHCVSNYPTLPENAQLGLIETMRLRYPDIAIGYSDHTLGTDACFLAAGLGARIIEKHFTMSHTYSDFRDHALSANPDQMTTLMKMLPEAYSYVGRSKTDCERNDASMVGVRRKAIANRSISAGETFSKENVDWMRIVEDKGIVDRDKIYGLTSASNLSAGAIISFESIQN